MTIFPSDDWLFTLKEKLNHDEQYAKIAKQWEGDLSFEILPEGSLTEKMMFYLDLWHGTCRDARMINEDAGLKPAFTLIAPYPNFVRILKGELDPMQAMLTRKLQVHGNMGLMMRNVPTILDFVRCCKEISDGFI